MCLMTFSFCLYRVCIYMRGRRRRRKIIRSHSHSLLNLSLLNLQAADQARVRRKMGKQREGLLFSFLYNAICQSHRKHWSEVSLAITSLTMVWWLKLEARTTIHSADVTLNYLWVLMGTVIFILCRVKLQICWAILLIFYCVGLSSVYSQLVSPSSGDGGTWQQHYNSHKAVDA